MPYVRPEEVTAPADHWQHRNPPMIIYNGSSDGFSVAEGAWDGEPCLGIRWNGGDGPGSGFPTAGPGHPAWFIVPRELEAVIRITLAAMKSLSVSV